MSNDNKLLLTEAIGALRELLVLAQTHMEYRHEAIDKARVVLARYEMYTRRAFKHASKNNLDLANKAVEAYIKANDPDGEHDNDVGADEDD